MSYVASDEPDGVHVVFMQSGWQRAYALASAGVWLGFLALTIIRPILQLASFVPGLSGLFAFLAGGSLLWLSHREELIVTAAMVTRRKRAFGYSYYSREVVTEGRRFEVDQPPPFMSLRFTPATPLHFGDMEVGREAVSVGEARALAARLNAHVAGAGEMTLPTEPAFP